MDLLHAYYRGRLKVAVGFIVTLAVLFRQFAQPEVPEAYQFAVRSIGSALVGVLFLTAEWFIRTHLWKYELRNVDFSGVWRGTTTYTALEKPGGGVKAGGSLPAPSEHKARIDQNCLRIQITATEKPFVWYSLSMDITSAGQLGYAYEVSYKTKGFPPEAIGYEKMNVVEYGRPRLGKKRPVKLAGTFAHCAYGQAPVYRGTVEFELINEDPQWTEPIQIPSQAT